MSPAHLFVALKPINPLSCRFTAPEVIYRLQTASRTLCNEHSTPPPQTIKKPTKKKKTRSNERWWAPGWGPRRGEGGGAAPGAVRFSTRRPPNRSQLRFYRSLQHRRQRSWRKNTGGTARGTPPTQRRSLGKEVLHGSRHWGYLPHTACPVSASRFRRASVTSTEK